MDVINQRFSFDTTLNWKPESTDFRPR
jgi:hypothetical protein